MSYEAIEYRVENGVAHVRLNRPEQRNAINQTMYGELIAAFEGAGADVGVHCVLLSAAGTSRARRCSST